MKTSHRNQLRPDDVPPIVNVLGVNVWTGDLREAVWRSDALIRLQGHGYICAVDVHSLVEALRDPAHRAILNNAFLTVADGMPLVWMGRLRGFRSMERVYGPDFLLEMCRQSLERGWRHFFYGGGPGTAAKLAARLQEKLPGLQVVGTYAPPFRSLTLAEENDLADRVEEVRPDIVWVGLGAPKQERFMAEHCGKLRCHLMVGVGAAFDFHSDSVKEAPRWLHRTGFQWAYRLMQEPRRLGPRYLHCIPAFLWHAGLDLAGVRRFSAEATSPNTRAALSAGARD